MVTKEQYKNGLFSSERDDWATPQWLYDKLNKEFHFTLDPCSSELNHKCDKYYTIEDDGLSKEWTNETVFVNPPYGREIGKWVKKCYQETFNDVISVMLIPSRTDTKWFHDYIYNKAEVRFLNDRIIFEGGVQRAPFPSMIVIFRNKWWIDRDKINLKLL